MIIVTPTNVPPSEVTASDVLSYTNVAESTETLYNPASDYVVGNIVLVKDTYYRLYESISGTSDPEGEYNTGNYPPTSPAHWLDLGATNRWKMFDKGTGTRTENADLISVTITPPLPINALVFFNLDAAEVYIAAKDSIGTTFYEATITLFDNSFVSNWYDYFFEPIVKAPDKAVVNLPSFGIDEIDIEIRNPSSIAKCGLLVVGRQKQIGTAVYGSSVSIKDYSRKEPDEFGGFEVVERRFSKLADYDIVMRPSFVRPVQQLLSQLRATPAVYIGDPDLDETVVYGYYRDFTIVLSDFATATTNLQVEGL